MLYELRRYDVAASKLPALVDRFGSFTVHKWKEYGFRLIGFWTPLLGEKSNQVVYIWGWESYEERTKKNAAWRADPERAKKWAETEKDGPLVNRVYNQLMEPTSYSQLDQAARPTGRTPPAATRTSSSCASTRRCRRKITNITDRFGGFTCECVQEARLPPGGLLAESHRRQRSPAHLPSWPGRASTSGWPSSTPSPRTPSAPACSPRARRTAPSCSKSPTRCCVPTAFSPMK